MKTCKIYCTYFGVRRGDQSAGPSNADETLEVLINNIENDYILNPGVENMDIIIINNKSNTMTQECSDYLDSINNTNTPYGKIIVLERENFGGSLAAYSFAFDKFEDEYDYWFFIEDDLKMIYPNYYKMIVDEFDNNKKMGFLAFTIIHLENTQKAWVSGGFGASKKEVLKEVKNKFGKLPYDEHKNKGYGNFGQSELIFSGGFTKLGYTLNLPKNSEIIPMGDNWEKFPPHVSWQKKKKFNFGNKKFLYHIGL
jgi:GT2 family glycosyltransferase